MKIGAQLYTVRDYCKTPDDLANTLAKVAEIGYTSVQLSGVCAYEADWMKEQLRKNGLTADLTHFSFDKIVNHTKETIDFHRAFGCEYIGIGSNPNFDFTLAGTEKFIGIIKDAVHTIGQAGMKFMYHNHHMEFGHYPENGKTTIDMLCEAFPASEFGFTLDCYWAQEGGADPIALIKRLAGRLDCVHYKDMTFSLQDKGKRMAAVGRGNMNYEGIIEASLENGVKYAFVEQDSCYEENPFDCLKQSYDYLVSMGLK
ncbi:MAG: sugar phosphate isomerase/epimerase [Clostridia bacterium]|nr:sugar phosphate isomerase/epimerase [Clostridia bacterium]